MEVVEGVRLRVSTLLRFLLALLVGCFKALLPIGILPRKNVTGERILITGSAGGIGRLMAVEFAKLGGKLVLWDINEKENNETKRLVEKQGATTAIILGQGIDNSSVSIETGKKFVKGMIKRNHGHLVTIASICGKAGSPGLVDYCASKHGAVGFNESIAAELRRLGARGVKTTVVCPWAIDTGMFDGFISKSPTLMPILDPSYVVECIMEAVLTEKEEIQIPRFSYVCTVLSSVLPTEARMILMDYMGIFEGMDTFTGRVS